MLYKEKYNALTDVEWSVWRRRTGLCTSELVCRRETRVRGPKERRLTPPLLRSEKKGLRKQCFTKRNTSRIGVNRILMESFKRRNTNVLRKKTKTLMAYRKRNCTELNPGVHAPKNKCLIYHYFLSLRMFYKYERFWKGSMNVNY